MNKSERIFGLDFMRAIAIVLVLFSHISWIIPETNNFLSSLMGLSGYLGVEIFFVLSGFLIGRIIYNMFTSDDFNFSKIFYFWIRRWFRTLPNYYLVLGLNIIIAIYLGMEFPNSLWKYCFFIQNLAWEMPAFFPESWSLSIEEFAYIVGPLLLYLSLFYKTSVSKSIVFLRVTLLIIFLFTISKCIYNYTSEIDNMTYWNINLKAVIIYRIDAIYYGVLAAFVSIVKPQFWYNVKCKCCILGVVMIISLNILISSKDIFIESNKLFWNLFYIPINSIVIVMFLPWLSQIKTAPKYILRPITFLSLISYSMYLFHYSIILYLLKYYLPTENLGVFDSIIYIIVYLLLTVLISLFVYKFYEKPIMNFRENSFFVKRFLNE